MPGEENARQTRDLDAYRQLIGEFAVAWVQHGPEGELPRLDDFLARVPAEDEPSVRLALQALSERLGPPQRGDTAARPAEPGETMARDDLTSRESARESARESTEAEDAGPVSSQPTCEFDRAVVGSRPASDVETDFTLAAEAAGSEHGTEMTVDQDGAGKRPISGGLPLDLEDYEVLQELGRGGMGVVYKALEKNTHRLVCIKMMLSGEFASPEALRRFQVETEAAASLDHPNIVPVYRAGVIQGIPYFAMKFIDGKTMNSIDRRQFKEDPRKAVELMAKISRAVQYAHSRGILHRDLKPANILLDSTGEPHVTDFGLAKNMNEDTGQTRTGLIMGTPDYMSPEQAAGASALTSVTSDVYSLGSILFDMLTGQPPFHSATIVETLSRVTTEPARAPTTFNKRVGKDLETICLKCLEKDPRNRYRSAAALADELERYLRGEPIQGRPVSSAERVWRWCRRNPGLASLSGALLFLLCAAAVGSSIAAYQINQRRNEAVEARGTAEKAQKLADRSAAEAKANAVIADQQRTLALETLHNLVTKVEAKLHDRADLADLQQDVLQSAFDGLQEVSRTAENSGLTDRTVGVAHQRMADILEQLGKTGESNEEHQKAIQIFETLVQADPNDEWAKWNAAISFDKLGDRLASTDQTAAVDFYQRSLVLREQLAESSLSEDLTAQERQRALLISAAKLGRLALQQGRPAEAREFFRKALKQSEAMLADHPENSQFMAAVAGSCSLLGKVSFSLRDLDATHDYCHRALELRQRLYDDDPTSVSATSHLAGAYDTLGDVELQTEHTEEARGYYQSAAELLEGLYEKDTSNANVKSSLSTIYYKWATAKLRLDDAQQAQELFSKCLRLREELLATDADDPDKQISVMLARARCGLHRESVELANQLRERAADNAGTLFYVVCGYALSAGALATSESPEDQDLRREYSQSALDTLEKTLDLGYRDVVALQTDPDLDPIRSTPRFQALLDTAQANVPR